MKKNLKGFTLIELMVVIAIIGILVAVAVPMFDSYRVRAYCASAQSDLRNFKTSMEASITDTQSYPVF